MFQQYPPADNLLNLRRGLSVAEVKDAIKLIGGVVPVRVLPVRSKDSTRCRHCPCSENYIPKTLPHVLGSFPFRERLRNHRPHQVRSMIAYALRAKGHFDVFEEVLCTAEFGSTRRVDILVLDRKKNKDFIIDPTIRFESGANQPEEVDAEKH